jgi:hypothetical protein
MDTYGEHSPEQSGEGRWLTYDELGQIRTIGRESAVKLAQRKRWRRIPGNDGIARVLVPLDWLNAARPQRRQDRSPGHPPEHSGELERERSRADRAEKLADAAEARADRADRAAITERARADQADADRRTADARADVAMARAGRAEAEIDRERARGDRAEQGRDTERARADALQDKIDALRITTRRRALTSKRA